MINYLQNKHIRERNYEHNDGIKKKFLDEAFLSDKKFINILNSLSLNKNLIKTYENNVNKTKKK